MKKTHLCVIMTTAAVMLSVTAAGEQHQTNAGTVQRDKNIHRLCNEIASREWKTVSAKIRKRRQKIIARIRDYKSLPEEKQQLVKPEILNLLKEDHKKNLNLMRKLIARMEEKVSKLKAELTENEADIDAEAEREFKRLLRVSDAKDRSIRTQREMNSADTTGAKSKRQQKRRRKEQPVNRKIKDQTGSAEKENSADGENKTANVTP